MEPSRALTEGFNEVDADSSNQKGGGNSKHDLEAHPPDAEHPSVVTDADRDSLVKVTQKRNGIIGPHPRGGHNVFTHCSKGPKCEVCKKSKTIRARCETIVTRSAAMELHSPQHLGSNRSRSENSERGKRVKVWTQNCSNRAT